jgi:hypothetical protein
MSDGSDKRAEAPSGGTAPADVSAPAEHHKGHLRRLVAYGQKVYRHRDLLAGVEDDRRAPAKASSFIAAIVFYCGLLRVRSFNALEPRLKESSFLRLLGVPRPDKPLCSIDTVSRALRRIDLKAVQGVSESIVAKAERNKVFRDGSVGALRYVAIDGWELFSSYKSHCQTCLQREIKFKNDDGTERVEIQYYHRYVVALLVDDRFDLFLDLEPLLPADQRPDQTKDTHEGEQTAALRLLERVKATFHWLDVVIGDALYANGPFLKEVARLHMGAVLISKKESDEPLKEALNIWSGQHPEKVVEVDRKSTDGRLLGRERHELWNCPGLETLDSYPGKIRVVRGLVTSLAPDGSDASSPSTWCLLVTGAATRLSSNQLLSVARSRWHIENTGFHQWTTCWKLDHVFLHDPVGTVALIRLFLASYNLLTLFLYTQVRAYGRDRGKDVTRTISRFVDLLFDDLARLAVSIWDTS